METFSIVKQLDEAKLREKIVYFGHENSYDPYIFANHGTLEVLKNRMNRILHSQGLMVRKLFIKI